MVNLSASPWHNEKGGVRQALVTDAARRARLPGGLRQRGRRQRRADLRRTLPGQRCLRPRHRGSRRLRGGSGCRRRRSGRIGGRRDPARDWLRRSSRRIWPTFSPRSLSGCATTPRKAASARAGRAIRGHRFRRGRRDRRGRLRPGKRDRVSLPSAISSQHSKDDARAPGANLGLRFETIAIADQPSRRARRRWPLSSPAGPATSPRRTSRPACAACS
jgi:hypothetical protein